MSEDEIIQMAVDCGITPWTRHEYIGNQRFTATDDGLDGDAAALVQFAQMVAEREREECAKVCEQPGWNAANWCANAIRARGKHEN